MKTRSKIHREFAFINVILGSAIILYAGFVFMSGIHNVDLAVNMGNIYGFDHTDTASDYNTYTYRYLYINGMAQIEIGAVCAIMGVFLETVGVCGLYSMVGRRDL